MNGNSSLNHTSASSTSTALFTDGIFREFIEQSVATILLREGFNTASCGALNLITEGLIRFMNDTAKKSHDVCENAGRLKLTPSDIWLALIQMNVNMNELFDYLRQRRGNSLETRPISRVLNI